MRIDVCVVIPARNRETTLAACIESVLGQSLPPHEVIIVDDRSTDRTAAIAATYANRGVRCIPNHRKPGAQGARNAGILAARASWIAFQDSDDVWLPGKLALQTLALARQPDPEYRVIHGPGLRRDVLKGTTERIRIPRFEDHCWPRLLLRPGPMFQGLLVHKDRLAQIGLLDESCPSYQEWDTAIRLARHCRFVQLDENLFEWHWHSGETISKDSAKAIQGFAYVMRKHRDDIVATHSKMAWRGVVLDNVRQGLATGCFAEVEALIDEEEPCPEFRLARYFARRRLSGRAAGTVLHYLHQTLRATTH